MSDYTDEQQAFLEHRTQELLSERLNDRDRFSDLLDGLDRAEIDPHLFRALANLDRAIKGENTGLAAVLMPLAIIQSRLRIESKIIWTEECRAEAEKQLREES